MSETPNTVTIDSILINSSHRFRKECMAIVPASIETCTKHMRVIDKLKGKESEGTIVPQAKFRPYHSEKIVGGTAGITARTLETFPLELLEEFDPEALYTTTFGTPVDVEKIDMPIVRKMLALEMLEASRGLCDLLFRGVRNANGTGALDGFNGFDTIIANEIAAGNIAFSKGNFAAFGEIDEYNIVDRFTQMFMMISEKLRGDQQKKLKLYCSIRASQMYDKGYAIKYGHGNFAGIKNQKYVDGTNDQLEIVPLPGMDGVSNFIISTQDNMKVGFDVFSKHTKFEVRKPDNPNMVQMHAKIYMGVDFANVDKEFLFVAACTLKSKAVYMVSDLGALNFEDTALSSSSTAKIKFFGFNLSEATSLTLEGTNAAMFSLSADSMSASDANASAGKEITVTFSPTTAAGEKTATLRVTNATDNVSMLIPLKGKGTSAG